jgi:hypothetical protein
MLATASQELLQVIEDRLGAEPAAAPRPRPAAADVPGEPGADLDTPGEAADRLGGCAEPFAGLTGLHRDSCPASSDADNTGSASTELPGAAAVQLLPAGQRPRDPTNPATPPRPDPATAAAGPRAPQDAAARTVGPGATPEPRTATTQERTPVL